MILYCRYHDLAWCEKHGPTPCFSADCKLTEEPNKTLFCAECSGLVAPKGPTDAPPTGDSTDAPADRQRRAVRQHPQ